MSGHVWSWIAGYGWTVMPYAPFRFERVGGHPRAVRVQRFSVDGAREAPVTIGETGEADRLKWNVKRGQYELAGPIDFDAAEGDEASPF